MRIPSNKISDIVLFFYQELEGIYTKREITIFIEYCFEEFLNIKKVYLKGKHNETVSESELLKFNYAVKDLKNYKPIQYIFGKADFYGMKFIVNEHVLIPRPETEELVHLVKSEIMNSTSEILDIGTGSGCIAITLKKLLPDIKVTSTDISEEALSIAKQNATLNNVEINFVQDDILNTKLKKDRYDIIVSNPPYICEKQKSSLDKNVLNYEPHSALFVNDAEPLLFYKAISDFALNHLKKDGKIYFEINQKYGKKTKKMLVEKGFKNVILKKDFNNNNRMVYGSI